MAERCLEYQSLKHQAQAGFHIQAPSLERLYIDSALAMTDQWVKLNLLDSVKTFKVSLQGETKEALMLNWLNQVLTLFSEEKFLAKRIYFSRFDGKQFEATLMGDTYNPIRHGHAIGWKALQSEQLQLGLLEDGEQLFFVRVHT